MASSDDDAAIVPSKQKQHAQIMVTNTPDIGHKHPMQGNNINMVVETALLCECDGCLMITFDHAWRHDDLKCFQI